MHRVLRAGGLLLGLFLIGNGLVMLADPVDWYFAVPGVTATGPFNQHFLRDIGLIYVMMGAGFLAGIVRPRDRVVLWAASTLWLAGHALFHFWEVSVGICGTSALVRDFPGVTTPAILGLALTVAATRFHANAPLPRRA
ncbi:MAG: hypothetical protein JWL96_3930 [Sphingomonas bacterium]|uniref:hypothetical protein n=1 Tax=Sphingomonas bacterium TaxID=1895847 RepID=UPI0026076EB3|nr:hypothetical protein [Sphingomonas bacterium]MDB5711860.1 hypothetical protein [Sphingomonas bacterium]